MTSADLLDHFSHDGVRYTDKAGDEIRGRKGENEECRRGFVPFLIIDVEGHSVADDSRDEENDKHDEKKDDFGAKAILCQDFVCL
jgi:hypothetical protein